MSSVRVFAPAGATVEISHLGGIGSKEDGPAWQDISVVGADQVVIYQHTLFSRNLRAFLVPKFPDGCPTRVASVSGSSYDVSKVTETRSDTAINFYIDDRGGNTLLTIYLPESAA